MESDENEVTILFRGGEIKKNFTRSEENCGTRAHKNICKCLRKTFDKKDRVITSSLSEVIPNSSRISAKAD